MDIDLSSTNIIRQFHRMYDILTEDEPIRVDFWNKDEYIGRIELGIIENDLEEFIEVRWVVIEPGQRNKGYLKNIINNLLKLQIPLRGEITEEYLFHVWSSLGADFINNWEWVIYPKK